MIELIIVIIIGATIGIIQGIVEHKNHKMTPDEAKKKLTRGVAGLIVFPIAMIDGLVSGSKKKRK